VQAVGAGLALLLVLAVLAAAWWLIANVFEWLGILPWWGVTGLFLLACVGFTLFVRDRGLARVGGALMALALAGILLPGVGLGIAQWNDWKDKDAPSCQAWRSLNAALNGLQGSGMTERADYRRLAELERACKRS
jgi:hypothetical protein